MADSRIGRAMKAVRDNQDAAEVMGVHAIRYKIIAFVVAATFAGSRVRSWRTSRPTSRRRTSPS